MKRLLTAAMIATFGLAVAGCSASGEIDDADDNNDGRDSSYKKTTTVEPDGDRTVKTEKKVND